jgi:hypothetical protein
MKTACLMTAILLLVPCVRSLAASGAACTLLTQDQVNAALGASVGAGTPISGPASCQWAGQGKRATLTITQPVGGQSAVDGFNAGKAGTLPGITKEPVSGVGDDAYFVYLTTMTRAGLGLMVRKGRSAFEVRVYGFDIDKAKPVAKSLAQNVAGKL